MRESELMTRRWEHVRNTLASEIRQTAFQPGQRLPPAKEIAARFSVNRLTVMQALNAMQRDGLVRVEHGVGTFVSDDVINYQLDEATSFTRNLLRQNVVPRRELVSVWTGPAPADVAAHLELEAACRHVASVVTVGFADETPISLATAYFPLARVPDIAHSFVHENSVRAALRCCGVTEYRRRWSKVWARALTPTEARHLRLTPASPTLVQENVDVLVPGGEPIKYGISTFRADKMRLFIDFDEPR